MDGWVTSRLHRHGDGAITHERIQDVESILDQNKRYQNEPQKKSELMGHHKMQIPLVIIDKWANEDGANLMTMNKYEASEFLKKKYNDPNWKYLRVR